MSSCLDSSGDPDTVIEGTARMGLDDTGDTNGDESSMFDMQRSYDPDNDTGMTSDAESRLSTGTERQAGSATGSGGGGGGKPFPAISTKVYYHIDDEPTPYLTEVHVPPHLITLGDVKRVLTRSNFKYYCRSKDPDSGYEVKAELRDEMEPLTASSNGRFELFLLTTEGSTHSDGSGGVNGKYGRHHMVPGPAPSSMYHMNNQRAYHHAVHQYDQSLLSTDSESMISAMPPPAYMKGSLNRRHVQPHYMMGGGGGHRQAPGGGGRRYHEESTIGSESDARIFSDDDDRGSTTTDITSVSRQHENMHRRRKMRSKNYRKPSRASSFSSITESSMSLDVITVTLNMDTVNFLGISIVGQSSARGDNGIYVANIMKGGAVALDGRIEAGDMILQVNDISFENFTNDQAVDVLRDAVARKGSIKLTVAKCFENGPKSCFTAPRAPARDEPVRPIDTQAWIQHTNAMRGMPSILEGSEGAPTPIPGDYHHHGRPPSSSTVTSGSAGGAGGVPQTVVQLGRLDVHTDKKRVVESMSMPGSGLDIKNRTWLKIPIPMSFLGSDLVDWLLEHVEGLRERKDARKYASDLLKAKLIAHVVNKITFTEQCYYVLGEECADFARYRTPLPDDARWAARGSAVPAVGGAATGGSMVSGYASMPVSPYPLLGRPNDVRSQVSVGSGDGSGSGSDHRRNRNVILPPAPPQAVSQPLHELPSDVAASRQSFRMAMDHPYELNELF